MSKKTLRASAESLPFCCGIHDVGEFVFEKDDHFSYHYRLSSVTDSPTGLYTASFIDTPECKEAYNQLCKQKVLLYKSSVVYNKNSGNNLFLCVFGDK